MPARRIEAGPLLVLLGAVLLLVALFLDWYAPGITAWDVFELLDLLLAALAVGAGLTAAAQLGALGGPDPRALPWLCAAAFVLVVATVLDAPPAVAGADRDTGLWVALAATILMAIGAVLVGARVRISLDVEGRRRRVSAVDSRRAEAREARSARRAAATPAGDDDAPFDQATDGPATEDDDERPAYRMSFDRDVPEDEPATSEPLRPDEPWAERPQDPGKP